MGRIVFGFIAGALAVLLAHQPIIIGLKSIGMLPAAATAYNMGALGNAPPAIAAFFKSLGLSGWPILFNQLFWGGLLGSIFGLVHDKLPGGLMLIKGLIYGLIVVVLSNWILVPLIKGNIFGFPNQAFFSGFDTQRMIVGAIIQSGFGLGTGLLYGLMRSRD